MVQCYTCTSGTTCSTCRDQSGRADPTTKCACIAGYFENNNANCGVCHYSCATCVTSTACATCDSITNKRVPSNTSSFCDCAVGYYNNYTSQTCLPCSYTCRTCINNTAQGCLSCEVGSKRSLISGACVCDPFTFDSGASTCSSCSYDCAACNNLNNCSSCDATKSRFLSTSTMRCSCLQGYFNQNT